MINQVLKKLLLALLVCHFFSCTKSMMDRSPDENRKEMSISAGIGSVEFSVEIADTEQKRAVGLMGRKSLKQNHGMLFIFDGLGNHAFWMKNTHISLDIIFFDDKLNVVGIIESATPMSLEMLEIGRNSRYVLEVLAGTVKKYGINLHTTAQLR